MKSRPELAPLHCGEFAESVRALREAGLLDSLEVHVVDRLGALVGERDPEVLLALALAVRAPRKGHICVNLAAEEDFQLLGEPDPEQEPAVSVKPCLPKDREAWLLRVGGSRLVRRRGALERTCPFVLDGSLLYTDRYYTYQERLAGALRARLEFVHKPVDSGLLKRGLSRLLQPLAKQQTLAFEGLDRQKLGAAMAVLRGFTVVSGGPGTGKTYTVRSVLSLLWAQWALFQEPTEEMPGPRVALAAPTGKAAARLREAMQLQIEPFLEAAAKTLPRGRTVEQLRTFLNSLHPSTIHRLLRRNPSNPTRFRYNADNPLPYAVVVIDETSMVDFALMAKLVDAVTLDTRLIFLGDQHQLSSVEAGTVLADLCGPTSASRLWLSKPFAQELNDLAGIFALDRQVELLRERGPYDAIVQLNKSRRFKDSSGIGQFAKACLERSLDPKAAVALLKRRSDVRLLGHGEDSTLHAETERLIVEGYAPYLERLRAGRQAGETLESFHRDVLRLFDRFRLLCAHRAGRLGVTGMNRKVAELLTRELGLNTREDYFVGRPILITRNDYLVELFNGDIGIVVENEQGDRSVVFPQPVGLRYAAPARLPDHQTVFAMTIHKSQGSEFQHAMVVLPEKKSPVLTRELIYTGVTRAQERMTLVGPLELLVQGLGVSVRRASGLETELWRGWEPKVPVAREPITRVR